MLISANSQHTMEAVALQFNIKNRHYDPVLIMKASLALSGLSLFSAFPVQGIHARLERIDWCLSYN